MNIQHYYVLSNKLARMHYYMIFLLFKKTFYPTNYNGNENCFIM